MRDYLKDFEDGILAILVKKSDFGEFLAFMEDKCGYDFDNARKGYLDNFTGIYKECVDVFAYIPKYSKTHRIIFSHTCSREQISWTELKKLLEDDPFNLATYTYLDQHHGMPSGHYLDFKDQSCADGMSVEALNYNARWFAGVYKTSDDARVACNTFKTINIMLYFKRKYDTSEELKGCQYSIEKFSSRYDILSIANNDADVTFKSFDAARKCRDYLNTYFKEEKT